jgi:hypothetical protein
MILDRQRVPVVRDGSDGLGIDSIPRSPYAYWPCGDLPEIPDDPAGIVYKSDFSQGVDGWGSGNSLLSVEDKKLKAVMNTNDCTISKAINNSIKGKIIIFKRSNATLPFEFILLEGSGFDGTVPATSTPPSGITSAWLIWDPHNLISLGGDIYAFVVPANSAYSFTRLRLDLLDSNLGGVGNSCFLDYFYIGSGAYSTPLIDGSGNGRHIAIAGGIIPAEGRFGKGLRLVSPLAPNIPCPPEFSLSFWMKDLGAVSSPYKDLVAWTSDYSKDGVLLRMFPGNDVFLYAFGAGYQSVAALLSSAARRGAPYTLTAKRGLIKPGRLSRLKKA